MLDPTFGFQITLGASLLFVLAAWHKVRKFSLFAQTFAAYRVVSRDFAAKIAFLVPLSEFTIAATLTYQPSRAAGLLVAASLLITYAVAMAIHLVLGHHFDCGCGLQNRQRPIATWMIWRNVLLSTVMAFGALPWAPRHVDALDVITIVSGVTVAAILYATVDFLLGEIRPPIRRLRSAS